MTDIHPLFRVIYQFIETPKYKKIFYFIGTVDDKLNILLKKIEKKTKLTESEKSLLKSQFKNDYKKILYYHNSKSDLYFINDKIYLDDTVINIKNKIFYYVSQITRKTNEYLNINNQLTWLGKKIILGYNYSESPIIPKKITKIKIDNKFIDKSGERKLRTDLITNNDLILKDIINKNNINLTSYKISVINANDVIAFLKLKKKHDECIINGWLFKYFPKYQDVIHSKCTEKHNKLKNLIMREAFINNLDIGKPNFNDYCAITTIKIKTNSEKIKQLYDKKYVNINLDNIFFYIINKSNLFGKNVPFVKINNYKNERSVLVWKNINKIIETEKIKSWIGLAKIDKKLTIKSNIIYVQFKKYFKDVIIKDKNGDKKTIPLYYTVSILRQGNIILNINFSHIYKINIKDILAILDDLGKIIDKINKNVRILNGLSDYKLQKPEIKYINNIIIKSDITDIDYINMAIINYESLKLHKIGTLLNFFKNTIKVVNKELDENTLNLKFKYIKVSNYLDIYEMAMYIKELISQSYTENQIIIDLVKNHYLSKENAQKMIKIWKKMYDKYKINNSQFNKGIYIQYLKNKIEIKGLKTLTQFKNILLFINKILYINKNYGTLKKDALFKKYFINIDNSVNNDINNNNNNYEDNGEISINDIYNMENTNNITIDANDYSISNNENNENNEIKEKINILDHIKSNYSIHSSLELKSVCGDDEKIDEKLQTCTDLCNDNRYFLRRLQMRNSYLFKYEAKNEKGKYSKACQRRRQPIILDNDPRKMEQFNKKSVSNVMEYTVKQKKQYYICPDAWCPLCNLPFSKEDLNKIETKMGINGKCTVAVCPNSTKTNPHELFVRVDNNDFNPYPGFSTKIKHPDGYCLPCCFKNNQNNKISSKFSHYKICIGEEIVSENEDTPSNLYVLDYKMPLNIRRFGLLPESLMRFFGKCERGYIVSSTCYLKRGIKIDINKSFINCVADLISPDKTNIINSDILIKNIIKNKNFTQKLFNSLNNGSINIRFKNDSSDSSESFDNFKDYLENCDKLNYEYLWDLIQRPGILYKYGCNIIIMDEYNIKCPYKEDIDLFYTTERSTFLIYTDGVYYEPIYKVEKFDKNIIMKCEFNKSNEIVKSILDLVMEKCRYKYDIDWHKILIEAEKTYSLKLKDFNYEDDKSLFNISKLLVINKTKEFQIKHQVLDNYNKVISVILENGLYIPTRHSRLIMKYDYIYVSNQNIKLDYKKSLAKLKIINKIINICNIKKISKIVDYNNKIIGILLNTGRILLVKSSPFVKDSVPVIDMSYYTNANHHIIQKSDSTNKMKIYMRKYKYEQESYVLFKLEFSYYINNINKIRKNIIEIINNDERDIIKRKEINNIIMIFIKNNVVFVDKIKDLDKYEIKNERNVCGKCETPSNKYHCKKIGTKCKYILLNKNIINGKHNKELYASKLTEEILRYEVKRNEILENSIPLIIDKSKIKFDTDLFLYINNSENPNKFNKMVNNFFGNKKLISIKNTKTFNNAITKHVDIDISKYRAYEKDIDYKTLVINMPIFWGSVLSKSYFIMNYFKNSVYYIIKYIIYTKKSERLEINEMKTDFINTMCDYTKYLQVVLNKKITLKNFYIQYSNGLFTGIKIVDEISTVINDFNYNGTIIDLLIFAKMYDLNIIIVRNRLSQKHKFTHTIKNNPSNIYIIVLIISHGTYFDFHIIYKKNKHTPIFEHVYSKLPEEFKLALKNKLPKKNISAK